MSISPTCDRCKNELTEFGAIVLSPPDNEGMVKKYHICPACYDEMKEDLEPSGEETMKRL